MLFGSEFLATMIMKTAVSFLIVCFCWFLTCLSLRLEDRGDKLGFYRATRRYNLEDHPLQEYYFLAEVQDCRLLSVTFLLLFDQPPVNSTTADVSLLQRISRYCSVYYNMRSQNGCHNIPARFPSYVIFISSFILWKCILRRLSFHSSIT